MKKKNDSTVAGYESTEVIQMVEYKAIRAVCRQKKEATCLRIQ